MKNLELEFDYATDKEQMGKARRKLHRENILAVEYCEKEDPLELVENLGDPERTKSLVESF